MARLPGKMSLAPHLAGPGLVGLFAVFLALSLRDPRPRWNYVGTDRRQIPAEQAADLIPAADAVFESIQPI